MAWLRYLLRGMVVAAALLALCVVGASLVNASPIDSLSAAERENTLKFLQGFVTLNPSLASNWTGTDFCSWWYVSCSGFRYAIDFRENRSPLFSGSLVLPELADDVNGSLVMLYDIRAIEMGEKVTGTLPASWGRLTVLQKLFLQNNALSGTLPAEWSGMTSLFLLRLDNNRLHGTLPPKWSLLRALYRLLLSHNTLSGTLPDEWGRMASLSELYLNGNALSGTLPAVWKATPNLARLSLSNNQLRGPIPPQWASFRALFEVDLSSNALCGCAPPEWKHIWGFAATVDPAVSASDCATANACGDDSATSPAPTTSATVSPTTTTITTTTNAPALPQNSRMKLVPLWCVLSAVGGALAGVAAGLGVYFYRRRQRKEAEEKRSRASEEKAEEPFAHTPDTPY